MEHLAYEYVIGQAISQVILSKVDIFYPPVMQWKIPYESRFS